MSKNILTIDGNEAVARIAYKLNEVMAIYPITPASPIGEWADQWASHSQPNLWGAIPQVVEMQSEGGAAGAVHGALQAGALTSTFTASQGLLLMIPNMYKIAGELTPTVFHIAARSIAAQALSIFGDHSDVMAARNTGFAMLAANSVQEVMDFTLISTAAALASRVPFLHFFDGFRTSHEINQLEDLPDSVMHALMDAELIQAHRDRSLNPERPFIRGTAQNPDVFFQARESVNPYYDNCPGVVQKLMDQFAELTGRQYKLFEYVGAPDATKVIVLMGSGAETAAETAAFLSQQGEKVGVVKVRLYRPFDVDAMIRALPATTKAIAVLDRTKEPGASGEPLYQDVLTAVVETLADETAPFAIMPRIIGGRYGLSSKEFTPGMIKAIFDELGKPKPKKHFTIGIKDDVTHMSLEWDPTFSIIKEGTIQALFYGLGSDGTVGANKNSVKIIGDDTDNFAQAYFVYDSKKAGSVTVSHLRFGDHPIHAPYLIDGADFVACHQFQFLDRFDVLRLAAPGATFLLNAPYGPDEIWEQLPRSLQQTLLDKQIKLFVIDAYKIAREARLGVRINTIMQTCFFKLSHVMPEDEAIAAIETAIRKTYGKRGLAVVEQNITAVQATLDHLYPVSLPTEANSTFERRSVVPEHAPEFVQSVTARMIEGLGDSLPVSALPIDGTYPCGTTQWEKRNIATEIPVWDPDICIQCGKCVFVCPHAVIRAKVVEPEALANAPESFKSAPARFKEFKDQMYSLQVAPEDCTGCTLCVDVCPVKNKRQPKFKAINMAPQAELREQEAENWEFFKTLPEVNRIELPVQQVKYNQLLDPLFEFSGACAGCGETPYLTLLSRLFGDRTMIANATGCSSIYGGNLPTTPWTTNADGRGPAWSNSLFEDNAEFGLGMRVALDQQWDSTARTLCSLSEVVDSHLCNEIITADQTNEAEIEAQRQRIADLKVKLQSFIDSTADAEARAKAKQLLPNLDMLVKKNVWIVGGDGWAYDIGYGGLDHVLASGRNVNVLVMDTEVYSNTGGQKSKATPRAAVAKFAAGGNMLPKKDLAMLAMSYGNIYVARIAFGANDKQTVQAFLEAEAYEGPSLIIAYSHCIAHGYDLKFGPQQQKAAVSTGYWPLFRFNPSEALIGRNPLLLDSRAPKEKLESYMYREGRFRILTQSNPQMAEQLLVLAQQDVNNRWRMLEQMQQQNEPAANGHAETAVLEEES